MDPSKRCVATVKSTGERCQRARVPGATVCSTHGGSIGRVKDAARRRLEEQNARELAKRSVVDLSKYSDPIAGLEFAVSASYAMAERLAQIAAGIPDSELVWRNKSGEHVRGEVVAAMKALADLRSASTDALRIGLESRRVGIREATVDMLDRS